MQLYMEGFITRSRKAQVPPRPNRDTNSRLKMPTCKGGIGYQQIVRMWAVERLAQQG